MGVVINYFFLKVCILSTVWAQHSHLSFFVQVIVWLGYVLIFCVVYL